MSGEVKVKSKQMHTWYQPRKTCTNKKLMQHWDEKYYGEHREKVYSATQVIDNKPPQTYMHLHLKLKKMQLEEERLATVERDNRILLEKMSYIMRSTPRVDNRNKYQHNSLNETKRQRELLRVTHENQAILRRITAKPPEYSRQKDAQDWDENKATMERIGKYPKDWLERVQYSKRKQRGEKVASSRATPRDEQEVENVTTQLHSRHSSAQSERPPSGERAESRQEISLPAIE